MKKICKNCGLMNTTDSDTCPRCGQPYADDDPEDVVISEDPYANMTELYGPPSWFGFDDFE